MDAVELALLKGADAVAMAECWRRIAEFYERRARTSRQAGARAYYRARLLIAVEWVGAWAAHA